MASHGKISAVHPSAVHPSDVHPFIFHKRSWSCFHFLLMAYLSDLAISHQAFSIPLQCRANEVSCIGLSWSLDSEVQIWPSIHHCLGSDKSVGMETCFSWRLLCQNSKFLVRHFQLDQNHFGFCLYELTISARDSNCSPVMTVQR